MTRRFDQEWEQLVSSRTWLVDYGLRLLESRGPEGMSQGFDAYIGDRFGLRIVADRGHWFVEVHPGIEDLAAGGWDGWFSLEAWSVCIGQPRLFHDSRPTLTDQDRVAVIESSWWLEPQLDFLREHLHDIQGACSAERVEGTLVCLRAAQRSGSAFHPTNR